jgi:hypothetical protein
MQLKHWTFLVEIFYRLDLRKGTSLLISNKAIIEYIYDSLNKCSGLPDTSKQTAETHLVFVTCYKAWTDTVLKTGVKMIAVSSMVHVYKIANEKLAYMYYFKKQSRHMHSFIFPPCKTQQRQKWFPSYDIRLEPAATGHSFELYCSINNWIRHTFHNLETFSRIYTFKTVASSFQF